MIKHFFILISSIQKLYKQRNLKNNALYIKAWFPHLSICKMHLWGTEFTETLKLVLCGLEGREMARPTLLVHRHGACGASIWAAIRQIAGSFCSTMHHAVVYSLSLFLYIQSHTADWTVAPQSAAIWHTIGIRFWCLTIVPESKHGFLNVKIAFFWL